MSESIDAFLARERPPTPCLVLDLDVVRANHTAVRAALPAAEVLYAVKANPAEPVLRLLVELGAGFDVASVGEVDLCLAAGAEPARLSYGNTIKKPADVAYAYRAGVRRFTVDTEDDLVRVAAHAPGAVVSIRFVVDVPASTTPFGGKFGCSPDEAARLVARAGELDLTAGLAFHVGSQQCETTAWARGIEQAAAIAGRCGPIASLNLGGGFPVRYADRDGVPDGVPDSVADTMSECSESIVDTLARFFPDGTPPVAVEPGRILVATAGLIRTEVVSIAHRSGVDGAAERWVYLDVGRYNGLAETENEYIAYPIRTGLPAEPAEPVVLAGPTCDGDDVLYRRTRYRLPAALRAGDTVDLLHAGAYTASYSSVAFNGIEPLPCYTADSPPVGAFRGKHVLAELHGVPADALDDAPRLAESLRIALTKAGATVCDVLTKAFEPQGVTVLALLAESHASIHTYPERRAAFVDVFTCGTSADPAEAVRLLADALGATSTTSRTIPRGQSW